MSQQVVQVPALVIFDCDGVLVDTERLGNDLVADVITARGFAITGEQARGRFVGLQLKTVREKILVENGVDVGDDFVDAIYGALPDAFATGVTAIPGIESAVAKLKESCVSWCVASSGKPEKMRLTLGSAGLLPLFENVLFSAYQVARGKPFPDLFLHAARSMGVSPEDCVVVEDAVPGVLAGREAGMPVFGYAGDPVTNRDALMEAGATVFDDMHELPGLIGLI